mmetsp:Transcript_34732/g.83937  ORF Transcript_34732/g.83937 Transcript_34732/m.83937 type:complete len:229 (-) Transcript_34732:448-1134(-)
MQNSAAENAGAAAGGPTGRGSTQTRGEAQDRAAQDGGGRCFPLASVFPVVLHAQGHHDRTESLAAARGSHGLPEARPACGAVEAQAAVPRSSVQGRRKSQRSDANPGLLERGSGQALGACVAGIPAGGGDAVPGSSRCHSDQRRSPWPIGAENLEGALANGTRNKKNRGRSPPAREGDPCGGVYAASVPGIRGTARCAAATGGQVGETRAPPVCYQDPSETSVRGIQR